MQPLLVSMILDCATFSLVSTNLSTCRKFDPGKRARELFSALDVDGEREYYLILAIQKVFINSLDILIFGWQSQCVF